MVKGFSDCIFTSQSIEPTGIMADNFKKIDREYKLGDSSLNTYKYRLLTSGYLFDEFKKNPIGYYMHGTPEFPREKGVLVKWDDLRIDGDIVYGKPCINLNHIRGQRTVEEIEAGFLNGASMGNIVVIEISDKPDDYLEGQTGITASKWFNRECSLVDIPGSYCATADDLLDVNENPLNLFDFNTKKIIMKQIILTPAQLALLLPNLKADTTPDQSAVDTALADLVAKGARVDQLVNDLATANTAKGDLQKKLDDISKAANDKEVNDLLAAGLNDHKITKDASDKLALQYATNPSGLKDLLAALPVFQSVVKQLGGDKTKVANLVDKSYDELDKAGQLENLLANNPEAFYEKYEGHFNKKHANDTRVTK